MLLKSLGLTCLFSLLVPVFSRAEIKNLYEKILSEHDIHPPSLQYGYPLWYQYDSLPVTGIIFLKNDLDDLYRMDKLTYVAEPTKENAEVILNFSGDVGAYPKFYIVPDSNLTWKKVDEFMQYLTPDYYESHFLLCSANGVFINYTIKESSIYPGATMGCGMREERVIMNNCRGDILLEGEFIESDSLSNQIYHCYWDNYFGDVNLDAFYRTVLNKAICTQQIHYLKKAIIELDSSEKSWEHFYQEDIYRYQRFLAALEDKGNISLPSTSAFLNVQFQYCERFVSEFYTYLDLINRGVYLSREKSVTTNTNGSYESLFRNRQASELEIVHAEFPDLMVEEYYNEELGYWANLRLHLMGRYE